MSNEEMAREQEYVSMLYGRLDDLRKRASGRLSRVLRQTGGTPQARTERDAFSALYTRQLAQFDAAEHGLCFGRLEFNRGERRYIGRLGLHSETDDYEQLLMDWRAAAARPFYLATAASPGEVKVRRHIKTRSRTLLSIDDEVLDLAAADPTKHEGLTGESALLAALNASRTGTMGDIVETIQAEQDRIIRSDLSGVLVVQGGPGTGKTAVALHRAAFLLYTYRRQLEKRGVLVVGPNATFLRYIGQVLPSLGETSVLLSTIADLYPGVSARGSEPPQAAAVKGRLAMAGVIAAAIRDRQRIPADDLQVVFDREKVGLSRQACARARERARRSRWPHNQARQIFAREVITALTRQVAARLGANVLGGDNLLSQDDLDDLRRELSGDAGVRAAIDALWPVLTPQRLLADLYSSASRLASAAPSLTEAERAMLLRQDGVGAGQGGGAGAGQGGGAGAGQGGAGAGAGQGGAGQGGAGAWTPADVPLLDEAAELLGEDDRAAKALADRRRRAQVAYAQGVLDIMSRDLDDDPEILMGSDVVDAAELALRHTDADSLTAVERAAADRTWAFGHVIVDEAQELSEMSWRMLMRRCPGKSMTIVGDVAQTGDLAGMSSWQQALGRYMEDRWRLAPLTINYRTPAEIMAVAADVLAAIDPALELPRSVRESGTRPWRLEAAPAELAGQLAQAAVRVSGQTGDGRVAVIVPAARLGELGDAVSAALPGTAVGESSELGGPVQLESPVVVLSVRQVKGLEFDAVLIADPAAILAESARGLNDLYVALTRATQRLGVVHSGKLPGVLAGLSPLGSATQIS